MTTPHAQEAAAYRAELQARQTIAAGFPRSPHKPSCPSDVSTIRRIRPGLYETVDHASPRHACTIEEIRPGHECHEHLGTGWMLYDALSRPVCMFDTLREAATYHADSTTT